MAEDEEFMSRGSINIARIVSDTVLRGTAADRKIIHAPAQSVDKKEVVDLSPCPSPVSPPVPPEQVKRFAAEEARNAYLQIWDEQKKQHAGNPLWWKQQMLLCGRKSALDIEQEEMKRRQQAGTAATEGTVWKDVKKDVKDVKDAKDVTLSDPTAVYSVAYAGQLYEIPTEQDVILIGRAKGCDIRLPQSKTLSRMHLAIFLQRKLGTACALDLGSLGVTMLKREDKARPLVSSVPGARNGIVMGLHEFVVFQLSVDQSEMLVLCPKQCIVCMERPRGIKFACGHHVACELCAQRLTLCPVCRAFVGTTTKFYSCDSRPMGSD